MDGWIVIPNWRRFQHYRDRQPRWIKVYTELMSDPAFLGLTFAQRGLLISLWLEYARSRRAIRVRAASVSRQLGGRVASAQLEALSDAGFIEVSASKPAGEHASNIAGLEVEVEKKVLRDEASPATPKTNRVPLSAPTPGRVNMPASDELAYVEALIRNGVITEPVDLDGYNLEPTILHQLKVRLGG